MGAPCPEEEKDENGEIALLQEDKEEVHKRRERTETDGTWREDDDDQKVDGMHHKLWYKTMTHTELTKVHLARALIVNPEVMVLDKPLHHYTREVLLHVASVIKEHVQNRGLCLPAETLIDRRPRTVFMSTVSPDELAQVDRVWNMSEDGI